MAGGMIVMPVVLPKAAFTVLSPAAGGQWGNQPSDGRLGRQASLLWPSGAMLNRKGAVMPRHPLAGARP